MVYSHTILRTSTASGKLFLWLGDYIMAKKKNPKKVEYKKCEVCGKRIPKMRLEALPHTLKCVKCAEDDPIVERYDVVDYNNEDCIDILKGDG